MLDNQTATKKENTASKRLWNVKLMSLVILSNARQLLPFFLLRCSHSVDQIERPGEPEGQDKEVQKERR